MALVGKRLKWQIQIVFLILCSLAFISFSFVKAQQSNLPPTIPQDPVRIGNGINNGDFSGSSLAFIGDVNADNYQEFASGAPGTGTAQGRVYIYDGNTGAILRMFTGVNNGGGFGKYLINLGDVNSNNLPDIAIVEPYLNGGTIYVYDYNGALLWSVSGNSQFPIAQSVAACDVSNDGVLDLIVGSPSVTAPPPQGGGIFMYNGLTGSLINQISPGPTNSFGFSVDCMGDLNNDNIKEIVIGAPNGSVTGNPSTAGSAYIYSASGNLLSNLDGYGLNYNFGTAVANAGDYNGDGINDFAVSDAGASTTNMAAGAVNIFSGANLGGFFQPIIRLGNAQGLIYPFPIGGNFGSYIKQADLNGDNYSDIVVGSLGANIVYTFLGPSQSSICAWGNQTGLFGTALDASDANGDGLSEVLIGDPYSNSNKGRSLMYTCGGVWSWGAGPLTFRWIKNTQNPQTGTAIVTGATSNSQGYLLSNTVPAFIPLHPGNMMLIDPSPGNNFQAYPFTFDANGSITFQNITLFDPQNVGANFYFQVAELIPNQPQNQLTSYRVSNGLQAVLVM